MGIIAVPPARLHPTLNPPDSVKLNPASWFAQQQTARVWHSNETVGLTDLSQNQNHAITQGFGIGKQPSQFGSGVYGDVSANPIPALSGYSTPVGSAMLTGASEITMWGVVCFSDLSQSNETDLIRAETYGAGSYQYAFDFFPSAGVFRPLVTTSGTTGWSTGNDVTVSGLKTGELYLMLTRWQSGQVFETLVQPVGSALAGYLSNTSVPSGTITSNGVVPTNIGGMGYAGVTVQTFPGWIYLAGVVGAYMPDGVVAELLADPFNYVLKPTNDLLPVHISGGGTGFAQAVSSTLTLGATYGRAIARAVAASATPQATTAKATARALTGSIASTGTETEQAGIVMLVTGTITAGATLARAFSRTITGMVSFAGGALRNTGRAVVAAITGAGTETEQAGIGLAVAGSIAMAAIVSTARQFTLALNAAIALGGAVARGAGRAVSGTVSATANASRATGRTLAGVLTATGTILQNLGTSLAVAGSIALGAVVSAVKGVATLTRSILTLLGVGN